jgi:mono/diheme cytochrome c family protein
MFIGLALALLAIASAGCDDRGSEVAEHRMLVEGDPLAGRRLFQQFGCGACHRIPGVRTARGRVGPSLDGLARRGFIAGEVPNRAPMLIRWMRDAPAVNPRTAMPAFAMTERQARDIAAYLYSLD